MNRRYLWWASGRKRRGGIEVAARVRPNWASEGHHNARGADAHTREPARELESNGHEDAEPDQGHAAILLPIRGRTGIQSPRVVDRHGQPTRADVRLVRRGGAFTSARAAFGQRIE